jgi:hypothetical protein
MIRFCMHASCLACFCNVLDEDKAFYFLPRVTIESRIWVYGLREENYGIALHRVNSRQTLAFVV